MSMRPAVLIVSVLCVLSVWTAAVVTVCAQTPEKGAAAKPAVAPAPAPAPIAKDGTTPLRPPDTPDEAMNTGRDLWKSLASHRWWFALALGIYMLLFILGRLKVFEKVGTFWAWVLVASLSLAAGLFAAFDKLGFNWKTFFEYATAGPTIAYLRDFGKDVVVAKLKEMKLKKSASSGTVTSVLLCFVFLASSGCSIEKQLIKVQTGTTALRQEGTVYFDNQCMAVALKCPRGKPEECSEWMKCRDIRRTFYAGTNGVQLLVAAGLNLIGIDKEADARVILLQVTQAVLELHQKLKELQVYEAALTAAKTFGAPAVPPTTPPPVAPTVPASRPASAPGVR